MSAEQRAEAEAMIAVAEAMVTAVDTPTWSDMVAVNTLIGRAQVLALLDLGDRLALLDARQAEATALALAALTPEARTRYLVDQSGVQTCTSPSL